tara:strand:- start:1042 stop:1419 length:378 start_codon:yes stop_codon:yes gene_type:complete
MALSVARFEADKLTYKIVVDTTAPVTATTDVTQDNGKLYSIDVENGSGSTEVHLKITLTDVAAGVIPGTTHPDIVIYCPVSSNVRWKMPDGITFTKLSYWAVSDPGVSSTGAISGGNVKVTFITS